MLSHSQTSDNISESTAQAVPYFSGRNGQEIISDENNHQIWKAGALAVMRPADRVEVTNNKQHKLCKLFYTTLIFTFRSLTAY